MAAVVSDPAATVRDAGVAVSPKSAAVAASAAACSVTLPVVPICVNVTVSVWPALAARYASV